MIHRDIDRSMKVIIDHGGKARDICELTTNFNDHLTRKVISLAEVSMIKEGYGLLPIPYTWIALGSEGRREQTLRTDQDNAIIFSDVSQGEELEAQRYFLTLAEKVVSGLERCGFPRCRGGVMAVNPKFCQPLRSWRNYFSNWILGFDQPPQEILLSSIFLDLRPVYGKIEFVTDIIESISNNITTRSGFIKNMAENAILNQTPLSFFKRLAVEKSGEFKNRLDLKKSGLIPLVGAVRTLSLDQKIFEMNTLDRISALVEKGILTQGQGEDLRDALM